MDVARLRALTPFFCSNSLLFSARRNGCSPFKGIDTHYHKNFCFWILVVEMDVARLRALTHAKLPISTKTTPGRNGCSPLKGTDTFLPNKTGNSQI